MDNSSKPEIGVFANEVDKGLTDDPKHLSSKYFYDNEGSRLFQEIMNLPEYYLTRSELEIFTEQAHEIHEAFDPSKRPFDLIELGAGDGLKTAVLVEHLIGNGADLRFVPIDISEEAIKALTRSFRKRFPDLEINPEIGDYFHHLETFSEASDRKKIILFLGSNIGNFRGEQAVGFFRELRKVVGVEDRILIGFDLHKNPKTIVNAYDDSLGMTRRFNLNLLRRINRELGGDFDTEEFLHYASYHPIERAARSFLISKKDQSVTIQATGKSYYFAQWEPIFMEISQKYDLSMINEIAEESGFEIVANFFDRNRFFADSFWRPAQV